MIFVFFIERKKSIKEEKWCLEFNKKAILKLLGVNLFICAYNFLSFYLVNAPKYAIDTYLTNDMQAMFNMLVMPATLMLLIGGFIINPILVDIAEKYEKNKKQELKNIIIKIIGLLLIFGIMALVGSYFCGTWFLQIVYGLSFKKYKMHLLLVIIGAILYTFTTILGTVFIAFRKIKVQLVIAIGTTLFAFVISEYLVSNFGLIGGFYSYLATMIFRTMCYIPLIITVFKKELI